MSPERQRYRLACQGTVQGVGFRPFIFRLASELGLDGWVRNGPHGVLAEIEGATHLLEEFAVRFLKEMPPLAKLESHDFQTIATEGKRGFYVAASESGPRKRAMVPPDSRLCDQCHAEMADSQSRRGHYPFTVCTNCGPRFSLVDSLPYDRDKTSMRCFPLCTRCQAEYEDPSSRRFHTEPVCCPDCGPKLWAAQPDGKPAGFHEDALVAARQVLRDGGILALKGVGGFQFACDASSALACEKLRRRKKRTRKPFAVMVANIQDAHTIAELSPADEKLLLGSRSPILLVPTKPGSLVCEGVAPDLSDIGVMLPTTPLHVELFRGLNISALVMTSGNISEEPICKGNREALERLGLLADLFLLHDRDIIRRVDDSVARSDDGGFVLTRRSRGWAPDSMPLATTTPQPVLAMGGHQQVTICFADADQAFLSQHIGDLDHISARAFHHEAILSLGHFLEVKPKLIVVDSHPDFPSHHLGEELAAQWGAEVLPVQHHLAHVAAAAAEFNCFPDLGESLIGIALDGTGLGTDGTSWGGEVLQLHGDLSWQRHAHLQALPLLGGEAAVREPWRIAVAGLAFANKQDLIQRLPMANRIPATKLAAVVKLATNSQSDWPQTSGAGRLFEAAGAMFGLLETNSYEAEAAMRFESLASQSQQAPVVWEDMRPHIVGSPGVLPSAQLLAAAARRLISRQPMEIVAADFHATFCYALATLVRRNIPKDVRTVALGGGCLVNRLLRRGLHQQLKKMGYKCLFATEIPPGDGGLSFGQATLGAVALARNVRPTEVERKTCV